MKDNLYAIVITTLLFALLIFVFYRVSNLEYKYETLKESNIRLSLNTSLSSEQIKERQFKEELYIRQQEKDTTLILLVFTITIGVFSFLTFTSVKRTFDFRSDMMENKYQKYISEYEIKHSLVLELKSRLDLDNAFKSKSTAYEFLRNNLFLDYTESMLTSIKYNVEYYLWFKSVHGKTSDVVLNDIIRDLKRVYANIKNKDFEEFGEFLIYSSIKEIRKADNLEVEKYVSLIYAEIKKT